MILIILDALRPDHLGCYGYSKDTSPSIDRLSQQGSIFRNAFSQSNLTLPSVVSIFTSLYPFSHGVSQIFKDKLTQRVYTLAQILNIYGYKTVWFGNKDDPHSGSAPEVLKGFNEKCQLNNKIREIFSWIGRHRREKFFITVHSYQTHELCFPFSRFNNSFFNSASKEVIEALDTIWAKSWEDLQESFRNNPRLIYSILGKEWVKKHEKYFMRPFSKRNLKKIFYSTETEKHKLHYLLRKTVDSFNEKQILDFLSLLDSSIFEIDNKLIKDLVNKLKSLNIFDKTIIIITADHGNEYKEHGSVGHGSFLYDESIRIPLIFYLPKFSKALKIDELVESIDIFPTVLDLLGIPIPYQSQGISLVGLTEGRKNALNNEYVFSQSIAGLMSIRSKEWKLIVPSPYEKQKNNIVGELFDIKQDRHEKNNLIKVSPNVAKELQKQLELKLNHMVKYQEDSSEFISGLDEETKKRIQKTGYW